MPWANPEYVGAPYVPTFAPPTLQDVPQWTVDGTTSPAQWRLYRHFQPRTRGVNVFQNSDDTFVVDTPIVEDSSMTAPAFFFSDDAGSPYQTVPQLPPNPVIPPLVNFPLQEFPALANTNIQYPWNWDDPEAPFSSVFLEPLNDNVFTSTDPYIVANWLGGHEIPISQATALLLTAAGFGDCIR